MRKEILKSLLCFVLVGILFGADAGVALASVSNESISTVEDKKENRSALTSATASVSDLYATINSDGTITYSYTGYGEKFEVYVNDVLIGEETYHNTQSTGANGEVPYASNSGTMSIGAQPGAIYIIKVIPYSTDVAGTQGTTFVYEAFSNVEDITIYVNETLVYNSKGKTTGYTQYEGVYGWIISSNSGWTNTYEVWRSTSKSSGYKLLKTVSGYDNVYWADATAKMGTKYYYKVRPVAVKDSYVGTQVNGAFSSAYSTVAGKPEIEISAYYTSAGVCVQAIDSQMTSGMEIYRSTKKSKGYKKIATTADASYIDDSAKSNKTYYYKVKPYFYNKKTGKKVYGAYTSPVPVKTNMAASKELTATLTSKSKAKLTWGKVQGAASYEIYMRKGVSGEAYEYLGSTKKLSYTVKSLSANTKYYFQIRAVKKASGTKTAYLLMSDMVDTGLHTPDNLCVTKRSVTTKSPTLTLKATLKWDAVYGASKYRIEAYDAQTGKYKTVKTITKNSTTKYTLTNTKKKNGTWKYTQVRVVAVKGSEEYAASTADITTLDSVTGLKAKKSSDTSVKLTWKKVSGAKKYHVMRYSPNGQSCWIGTTSKTSITDAALTPGVTYTYTVTAYNDTYGAYSSSDASSEAVTNQVAYKHKMPTATISSVSNTSSKQAKITWKKASYAKKYYIYRATSKNGTYKKIGTSTTTTYVDKKLTKGKTYYYKVVAVTTNDAGVTVQASKSAYKEVKINK